MRGALRLAALSGPDGRLCRNRLAHPLFFGWRSVGLFITFLVCNPIANVLIRNGLLESWFAEKPNRIKPRLQTTNSDKSGGQEF